MKHCSDKLKKKTNRMKVFHINAAKNGHKKLIIAERSLRKIKQEKMELMMNLEDQKQISNSWYKELISVKKSLQEKNEKLLNYELAHNGNYESAVEAEAGRRLKSISKPLNAAVGNSLETVLSLVENLTQIKTLVETLVLPPPDASPQSHVAKMCPPLSKASHTSRRKNVVHPMVEGHVLQPAKISLSRMCFKSRLTEKQKKQLGRGSALHIDRRQNKTNARSAPSIPVARTPASTVAAILDVTPLPEPAETAESNGVSSEELTSDETPAVVDQPSSEELTSDETPAVVDPLEGPSWLYDGHNQGDPEKLLQKIRRSREHTVANFLTYKESAEESSDSDTNQNEQETPKKKSKADAPKKPGRPRGSLNKIKPLKKPRHKRALSIDKENVPPVPSKMPKLKSVSVVVTDCMKTYSDPVSSVGEHVRSPIKSPLSANKPARSSDKHPQSPTKSARSSDKHPQSPTKSARLSNKPQSGNKSSRSSHKAPQSPNDLALLSSKPPRSSNISPQLPKETPQSKTKYARSSNKAPQSPNEPSFNLPQSPSDLPLFSNKAPQSPNKSSRSSNKAPQSSKETSQSPTKSARSSNKNPQSPNMPSSPKSPSPKKSARSSNKQKSPRTRMPLTNRKQSCKQKLQFRFQFAGGPHKSSRKSRPGFQTVEGAEQLQTDDSVEMTEEPSSSEGERRTVPPVSPNNSGSMNGPTPDSIEVVTL